MPVTFGDQIIKTWSEPKYIYSTAELAPVPDPQNVGRFLPALGIGTNDLIDGIWVSDGWGFSGYPVECEKLPGEVEFRRKFDKQPAGYKTYAGDMALTIGTPVPSIVNANISTTQPWHPATARCFQWNIVTLVSAALMIGFAEYVPVRDGGLNYPGTGAPNASTTLRIRFALAEIRNSLVGRILARSASNDGVSAITANVANANQNIVREAVSPLFLPPGDYALGRATNEPCAIWQVPGSARQQRAVCAPSSGGMSSYWYQTLTNFNDPINDNPPAGRESATNPTVLTMLRFQ